MSTAIVVDENSPLPVRQISVAEYHELISDGTLGENDHVELLEGWIVPKMTHSPPHDSAIQIASEWLAGHLPPNWRIRIQSAVTMTDSEPEPDLAVVRGNARSFSTRHPGPQDIGLIIEVADSSLLQDRQDKARIYARAGIPAYWVINLIDSQIELFSEPTGPIADPAYRECDVCRGDEVVNLHLDATNIATIKVKELLP